MKRLLSNIISATVNSMAASTGTVLTFQNVFLILLCHVQCYLADKYFEEISQDTGKYCFGVEDSMVALEAGAVETLIVWENLDIIRYTLFNQRAESKGKSNSQEVTVDYISMTCNNLSAMDRFVPIFESYF